ncbi:MAG: PDZ domain-containing protein [Gemmatimonadetes bacterium]|nr:PDZ domain-containing protein [Gemmatimonadota bacterium]
MSRAAPWRLLSAARHALPAGLLLAAAAGLAAQQPEPATPPASGWLGFSYEVEHAPAGGGPVREVVRIQQVLPGSPAQQAGLQSGDTLLKLNGAPVSSWRLGALRHSLRAGETVRLTVRRMGREQELRVLAGPRPGPYIATGPAGDIIIFNSDSLRRVLRMYLDTVRVRLDTVRVRLDSVTLPRFHIERSDSGFAFWYHEELGRRAVAGAEFSELNAGLGRYFRTDQGLLVLRVAPETPAARAGLEAGDVIISAAAEPVRTIAELRRAVARSRHTPLRLEILRQGKRQGLSLPREDR